jgi:putrescine---pyruvate transaminase
MTQDFSAIKAADRKHHIHPFSFPKIVKDRPLKRFITSAEGIYQIDENGHRILDGISGMGCVNLGYGRKDIVQAMSSAAQSLSYHASFWECGNAYSAKLVEKLAEITPNNMQHFFFANSGSEANDTAVKMVRWFWKLQGKPTKKHIIGREHSYHGMNMMTASLTGLEVCHQQFDLPMEGVSHIPAPWSWAAGTSLDDVAFSKQCAQHLEDEILRLGPDNVGAFIGEPMQVTGFCIVAPVNYWQEIQAICKKYDVLLIADEVVTGFGRSGCWFAQDYLQYEADITVMAKGLTSAYFPMSVVALNKRVGQAISDDSGEFYHGYTCTGHPVGAAVAMKNIEIIEDENILQRNREGLIPQLTHRLNALADHPLVGEVRGLGSLLCLQLTADKTTRAFFPEAMEADAIVAQHALRHGAIVRNFGADTIGLAPPLVSTETEIDLLADIVEKALDDAQGQINAM